MFLVIPRVWLSKCVFHFLKRKLEYLFEDIYAGVQAPHRLVIEPREKKFERKFKTKSKAFFFC